VFFDHNGDGLVTGVELSTGLAALGLGAHVNAPTLLAALDHNVPDGLLDLHEFVKVPRPPVRPPARRCSATPARRAPGASRRVHGADAREALASFWTGSGGGTRIHWTCSAAGRTRGRGAHTSWSLRCARRNAALCGLCFDYRSSTGHGIAIAEASEAMLSVRAGCMGQSASHWPSSALDRAMPGA
jgi:hypothetical protein